MPRPSHLSPDNILRYLQIRSEPASTNEIAQGLHLKKADTRPLFKMLARLKKRHAIEELPDGRYRLPGRKSDRESSSLEQRPAQSQPTQRSALAQQDEVKGRLVLHHDGYGFVVPDSPMPQLDGDVFIPPSAIEDAMHGDHVLARIQHKVEIPRGQELTPGLWKKLGFSGSDETSIRGRRIPRLDELDGAVVNVELIRYPRGGASPTGRVIEILGRPGELGVDIEIIIRKHHLPHAFSAEILEEAKLRAQLVSDADREGREDFRHLPIVTIDGETARDFDDAVYVEHRADGG